MRTPPPGCGVMGHPGTSTTGTRINLTMWMVFKVMWPSILNHPVIGMMKTKKARKVSFVITEVSKLSWVVF